MTPLLYFLFFCSGFSGLIYQVVWVRVFGNVFGNTIYSASLVIAVFMLGLGAGSYFVGKWADRRYEIKPDSLLRSYANFELLIGLMGLGVSLLLPRLGELSGFVSSYTRGPGGWYVLSTTSYLSRAGIAVVLLLPITLLMGGTLTLLIRHLVRADVVVGAWHIALLYAVNTVGAALGCLLTDLALVPSVGLQQTQMIAVLFNVVAGFGALWLAWRGKVRLKADTTTANARARARKGSDARSVRLQPDLRNTRLQPNLNDIRFQDDLMTEQTDHARGALIFASLGLAMSGFAAMGMEILWFRHLTILLGAFRSVFSLLLTVILVGIGMGALIGGFLHRRTTRPSEWLLTIQGLFVAFALLGLGIADSEPIGSAVAFDPAVQGAVGFAGAASSALPGLERTAAELWFNVKPILLEVAVPALLMGFSFPLANSIIQRAERLVGHRAGALYFSNTAGAVAGSLVAGFLLLPVLGIQDSATVLMTTAALAVLPIFFTAPTRGMALLRSMALSGAALVVWLLLPSGYINARALGPPSDRERLLTLSEGLTEVVAVTEVSGQGRRLLTNGHPMSSTTLPAQRYMRALAHIPLLSIDNPESVLVIGFGVGNTTHAATLHSTVRRVEVADLSRGILMHARYFTDVNRSVLNDPKVVVYVNDGRQHLQMQSPASYDLITLEPPPIAYAGVASLYSKEFYELARARLTPKGYISQWLPAYQVPTETTLAMIRAFIDVFPQAVLLSGSEADLVLLGSRESRIEIDPAHVSNALLKAPAVQTDLLRLDLGSVTEIVGTFVGSAKTLVDATHATIPISDDFPLQEYDVKSLLNLGEAVPASVVDLRQVSTWCPKCFVDGKPDPLVTGLDTYMALLDLAYRATPVELTRTRSLAGSVRRVVAGSAYLGGVVPESADLHNVQGLSYASKGSFDLAILEFRESLRLDPNAAITHWHLGAALAARGAREEAVTHLRRSVELDPTNEYARNDLAALTRVGGRP